MAFGINALLGAIIKNPSSCVKDMTAKTAINAKYVQRQRLHCRPPQLF